MRLYGPRTNLRPKRRVNTMVSKYFRLEEFLDSSVARQKGISNLPSWEVIEHLKELALFLDQMRSEWGSGIKVTSGFRNEKLNAAVGGVKNSAHPSGYAADLQPSNGKFDAFVEFVKVWSWNKNFDQLIIEEKGKTKWLHVGLKGPNGQQRRMIFGKVVK